MLSCSMKTLFSILIPVVLAALAIPFVARARRQADLMECSANLRDLYQLGVLHSTRSGPGAKVPHPLGKEFWIRMRSESGKPSKEFHCPFRETGGADRIDYLGPADQLNRLSASDPLACDEEQNHGGDEGQVLRREGDVLELSGKEWKAFFARRLCIP